MLLGALRTLDERPAPALLGGFLWKVLALEGVGPSLERCGRCANVAELVAFDPGEGGFLCRTCRRGQAVDADTLHLIDQVLNGGLRAALERGPSRATAEAERLATLATEYHLDRRVRSAHRGAEITTVGLRRQLQGAAGDERDRYEDIAASAKDPGTERAGDEADIEAGDGSGIEVGREVDGATFE